MGCRRRIGDGLSTKVWKVPWLPCVANGYVTTNSVPELENIEVKSLFDEGMGGWDHDILNDIFNSRDRELIRRIPIPLIRQKDSWFWVLEERGMFTVKSMYKQLQGVFDMEFSNFWKKLWSLKIPGKVATFLWRVCNGCLPTLVSLASKQVQVEYGCPSCRNEAESDLHVLFDCDFAKTVWALSGLQRQVERVQTESCFELLVRLFQTVTRDQSSMIGMICWGLWNRRNKWVWDRVNGSAFGVKSAALNLLTEWRKARVIEGQAVRRTAVGMQVWSKPPAGWKKINVDAATFTAGYVGIGGVIRDEDGRFIRGRCSRIEGNWRANEAEALSLKEALSWAKDLGLDRCVFESDSQQLVEACNGAEFLDF